jgi:trimethylamine--corrinoid protein Co-methyltransferase
MRGGSEVTEARSNGGGAAPYSVLGEADVEKVIEATFQLLGEVGVRFDPKSRALDPFSGAGCTISPDGIVRFPRDLVQQAIASAGRSVKLWNRSGTDHIEFSDGNTILMAGVTCLNVQDLESGAPRPATKEDLATITRVADALAGIDGVCVPCKIAEDVQGEIEEFVTVASNTTKPLTYLCNDARALQAAIEIAAAIRGGADRLRERPYFCFMVTPLPLHYLEQNTEHIFLCVENGIPLFPCTTSVGGAAAPITIAGNLVHCLATDLAALVLAQLLDQGSFFTCGSVPAFIDPATAEMGGLPETMLAETAKSQVLRRLGMPPCGGVGGVAAGRKEFDRYNACVATASMLHTAFSQPGYCWCLGSIDSLMTFSLEALLYCNELAGWVRRVGSGIRVDEETLALEVTRAVGPGGDYLAEEHTARHCRTELWNPKYFRFSQEKTGGESPPNKREMSSVIQEDLQRILATHRPEPLSNSVQRQTDSILGKYG